MWHRGNGRGDGARSKLGNLSVAKLMRTSFINRKYRLQKPHLVKSHSSYILLYNNNLLDFDLVLPSPLRCAVSEIQSYDDPDLHTTDQRCNQRRGLTKLYGIRDPAHDIKNHSLFSAWLPNFTHVTFHRRKSPGLM